MKNWALLIPAAAMLLMAVATLAAAWSALRDGEVILPLMMLASALLAVTLVILLSGAAFL